MGGEGSEMVEFVGKELKVNNFRTFIEKYDDGPTSQFKVGARKQMLKHARELSCLCLLVTLSDARAFRASPNPKMWKHCLIILVFINQTKCFRSDYDAHKSWLMKLSLWKIKIYQKKYIY